MTDFKRTLITSALPYANGPVHIGHLAGVYVPADIYARYLRMNGQEVAFIGGSDEHGVPITLKAKNEGVTPQDIVDKYHGMIKDSFQRFGISFDIYSRTSNQVHHDTASEFFTKLYNDGKFIEKTSTPTLSLVSEGYVKCVRPLARFLKMARIIVETAAPTKFLFQHCSMLFISER